jgi:hypothetical protein
MTKRTAFALPVMAGLLLGADFWTAKKPAEWTEKEAERLLEKSPWAKKVDPVLNMDRLPSGMPGGGGMGGRRGGMGGGGGMGGPGGGMGGPGGGDMGGGPPGGMGGGPPGGMGGGPPGGMGGMSIPAVQVTIETAAPIAAARGRLDRKDPFSEMAKEYVVISVSGLRMMGGGRPPQGGPPDPERMEQMQAQMQQRLLEATSIVTKEKEAFRAEQIRMVRGETGNVAYFAFPRKALNLDTKEFTFKTAMGPMEINAKFATKELAFDGKTAM